MTKEETLILFTDVYREWRMFTPYMAIVDLISKIDIYHGEVCVGAILFKEDGSKVAVKYFEPPTRKVV